MAVYKSIVTNLISRSIYKASKKFVPIASKFYLENFDKQGYNINGFVKWADLTDLTKRLRASKGFPYPQFNILVNTGRLRRGIKVNATTKGLNIFNNVSYADELNDYRPFIYASDVLINKYVSEIEKTIVNDLNSIKWI